MCFSFRSLRPLAVGLALAALTGCRKEAPPPEPVAAAPGDPAAVSWIRKHAVVLRTTEPGSDPGDLAPLREILGEARVVVLGEATHGTREFFRMKHRMVEFLVREMGFDIFAIEATGPEAARIDELIQTGVGDPERLLAGLGYWTWNTREVLDLVLWLRDHNRDRGSAPAVSFFGFDMQDPRGATSNVLGFLRSVDPPAAAAAGEALRCLGPSQTPKQVGELYSRYPDRSPEEQISCQRGLQAIRDRFEMNRNRYVQASSERAFLHALGAARVLVQIEQYMRQRLIRDRFMAENLKWRLDEAGPAARAVAWTHNGHASAQKNRMGRFLKKALGSEVVLVGFAFYGGSFNAVEQKGRESFGAIDSFRAPPPPAQSYERILHAAKIPILLLDLRTARETAGGGSWLAGPRPLRMIGASYQQDAAERYDIPARLADEYDLLLFVDETSPSTLLDTRVQ